MTVTLVVPAYNEERRLPAFLDVLVRAYPTLRETVREVLVVDDGSADRTAEVAERYVSVLPLRVLRLPTNQGKGAAVRAGVFAAAGELVIFLDADGATGPGELPKIVRALETAPIAVGNRWLAASRVRGREPFRAFSGWIYRTYVGLFGLRGIDTMCGCKGFRREVARELFQKLYDQRWLFDTEVMLRARVRGFPIANVPIVWTSKHGSKLRARTMLLSSLRIPLLVARVRARG